MNIFNSAHSFAERTRSGLYKDPARDWMVLLTLTLLMLIGIIVWNVWAFDTVANGGVIGARATSTPQTVDRSALDAIHGIFEKRAAEEAKYVTGVYRFADPSQ